MAEHTYSITDGTSTVYLTQSNGYIVTDADMGTAEEDKDYINEEPEIVDSLSLTIKDTSSANLHARIEAIETFLLRAKLRKISRTGPRIFLQLQLIGDSDTYRAEITDGAFKPTRESLTMWGAGITRRDLIIQHGAWESARREVLISSSGSSTPATGGKTITNGNNQNWVQIQSTQVGGTLPALVELQITNTAGGSVAYRNFHMAINAFSDPANFNPFVEGEDRISGYGTVTTTSGMSGGKYNHYTFTNTGEMRWNLDSAVMQQTRGRDFKLLARFANWSGTDLYIQPILYDELGFLQLAIGDEKRLPALSSTQMIDLGSLPLPNGAYFGSYADTTLGLKVRCTGAGSVDVDYIGLLPVSDQGYQHIVQRGYNEANGETITFDNIEGVYHASGANAFAPRTGRLRLWPGQLQKIYFYTDEDTGSNVSRTLSVRVYIRERRLTVG